MCSVYRNQVLSSFMTYHLVYNKSNTRVPLTNHHSGSPEFTSSFSWVRVARSLVFDVVFSRLLFVYFPLVIILSVLSWFITSDYRTLLISSNLSSYYDWLICCLMSGKQYFQDNSRREQVTNNKWDKTVVFRMEMRLNMFRVEREILDRVGQ